MLRLVIGLSTSALLLAAPQGEAGAQPKHSNGLVGSTSPYLLAHRHNPVDWQPWGPAALARAKKEGKPIFLSIGYAACHWCHVMERESFEDDAIAALLNKHFINIKVDREERPDIDALYMKAVRRMHGSGGWPMSVWLTPELKPFYGGTYYPPEDRNGRPGFKRLVESLAGAWRERRDLIDRDAQAMSQWLRQSMRPRLQAGQPKLGLLAVARERSLQATDPVAHGFGRAPRYAPKFPHPVELSFLLQEQRRSGDRKARRFVHSTLRAMARGGLYDHLGGGFHRYCVDRHWQVPHFEKMLYDNALLIDTYLDAWLVDGEAEFGAVARETAAFLRRELQDGEGGFYAALDADSEGEEGTYYIWTLAQVREVLGEAAADFVAAHGVSAEGNWAERPGQNVLHRTVDLHSPTRRGDFETRAYRGRVRDARLKLLQARARRARPKTDDKLICAWNGLAIGALSRLAMTRMGEERNLRAAQQAAARALQVFRREDGGLWRTFRAGAHGPKGVLEDYAFLAEGLFDLFEADGDPRWLRAGLEICKELQARFWDPADARFFTTEASPDLLVRSKLAADTVIPSGPAMALRALQRAALFSSDAALLARCGKILAAYQQQLATQPLESMGMLPALDLQLSDPRELVLCIAPGEARSRRVLRSIQGIYPRRFVLIQLHAGNRAALQELIPGLAGKVQREGKPTAYICRMGTCEAPMHESRELLEALRAPGRK